MDIKQCTAKVRQEASQGKLNPLLETASGAEERHDKIGSVVISFMKDEGNGIF